MFKYKCRATLGLTAKHRAALAYIFQFKNVTTKQIYVHLTKHGIMNVVKVNSIFVDQEKYNLDRLEAILNKLYVKQLISWYFLETGEKKDIKRWKMTTIGNILYPQIRADKLNRKRGWQDIKNAPKNGICIVVCTESGERHIVHWHNGGWRLKPIEGKIIKWCKMPAKAIKQVDMLIDDNIGT